MERTVTHEIDGTTVVEDDGYLEISVPHASYGRVGVTITKPRRRYKDEIVFTRINWSALGDVDIMQAQTQVMLITKAMAVAQRLDADFKNSLNAELIPEKD